MINLFGLNIVEDSNMVDKKQKRTHRKKRINKKWMKRYGFIITPKKDVYKVGDTLIMHPSVAKTLREQTMQKQIDKSKMWF